jgi:hypothetical protein
MAPLTAINLRPGTIMRASDDYCKQNGGSTTDRYLLIKNRKFTTKQFFETDDDRNTMLVFCVMLTLLAPDGQLLHYELRQQLL